MEKKLSDMTLDEQIAFRQKQISTLKARKAKEEAELYRYIGKKFCEVFADVPDDAAKITPYLMRVFAVYQAHNCGGEVSAQSTLQEPIQWEIGEN